MVFHMKTTLVINDRLMLKLKTEAAKQRRNMSELVEMALHKFFFDKQGDKGSKSKKLLALPKFNSGGALVDVSNRDALYDLMEGD